MYNILKKELSEFLNSLIAYAVITVFLTGIGLLMWVFPDTSILEYGYADMETLFGLGPYVMMFLIPAITMRTFAEEFKNGTIELLFTRPVTDWQIILGKYFAGLIIVIISIAPTLIYYFSVGALGNPVNNLDTPGIIGSYMGLILLGAIFTSVGMLSSSITRNQIVSFIFSVFICFILYSGFRSLAGINVWGDWSVFLDQLGIIYHYNSLSRGLIDTRNIVYFISVISLMLFTTKLILGSRKW